MRGATNRFCFIRLAMIFSIDVPQLITIYWRLQEKINDYFNVSHRIKYPDNNERTYNQFI